MQHLTEYRKKSDEEISLERKKLNSAFALTNAACSAGALLAGVGLVVSLICLPLAITPHNQFPTVRALTPLVLALTTLASVMAVFALRARNRQEKLIELLTPLSESSKCSLALSYIKRSNAAREIYNKVTAANRQFYMFDFKDIHEVIEQEDKNERVERDALYAQKEKDACRELHGITA